MDKVKSKRKRWVWKARWTSIREGKREWGKRSRTAEESIRSTTESVRETPINYDARNFARVDNFLYRKREGGKGRGDKGLGRVKVCIFRTRARPASNDGVTTRWGERLLKVFSTLLRRSLGVKTFVLSVYFLSQPP